MLAVRSYNPITVTTNNTWSLGVEVTGEIVEARLLADMQIL